ncbi:putative transcription factor TDA9 [Diplogelasinospora grovesii]|uniref:Transcription factor TDA9 n=1 Tax=Diplogelasinospora grovesii TaxID=303347 RepID=A0AAN6RZR7_9PEZI|nr:putative transcription factor TDA9 [Diplogelasinospora grovesii]
MASLKFIMDLDDDPSDSPPQSIKRDKDAGPPATNILNPPGPMIHGPSSSRAANTNNSTIPPPRPQSQPTPPYPRHASSSTRALAQPQSFEQQQSINQAGPAPAPHISANSRRRGNPSTRESLVHVGIRGFEVQAHHAADAPGPAVPSSLSSSSSSPWRTYQPQQSQQQQQQQQQAQQPPARRQSTTSIESMDQPGYGSAASSSSMGGRPRYPSNSPMRPMPPHPHASELPIKLTPITGRVSRAKKGVAVHTCDMCNKTYTRAEHLRRHQQNHQTPQFQCTYPGCDRAFNRSDLLARHQQRHDQEGDKVSSRGDESPRPPSAPRGSGGEYPPRTAPLQPGGGSPSPVVTVRGLLSQPTSTSSPGTEGASTPSVPGAQPRFPPSQMNSPAPTSNPPTPHPMGGGSYGGGSYTLSPALSSIAPAPGAPSYRGVLNAYQPRTTPPMPLGLRIPDQPPDLYRQDASPWASSMSSTSDSTISSTPDIPGHPRWPLSGHHLSPYPGTIPRDYLHSPGSGIDAMSAPRPSLYLDSPFSQSPQYTSTPHPHRGFDNVIGTLMPSFLSTDAAIHPHSAVSHSPEGNGMFRSVHPQHQHNNSTGSLPSLTPPPNPASHTSGALVAPAPTLSHRLDRMASLDHQKMALEAASGMDASMLGGLAAAFGSGSNTTSPVGDHDNNTYLAALDLPMGGSLGSIGNSGCLAMPDLAMAIPLPRPVRAAIPGYLNVYWRRVHPVLPIVHRRTFEAAPEDMLRCAMAAMATQYLTGREDRNRGNQLHEFAWQEAKRATQWNLQIMQAILLSEYFARFRGRKAVTRPSKQFESLYARVSSAQFFVTSSFSSAPSDNGNNALWHVDTGAWSPSSSSVSSVSSPSTGSVTTPTTATAATSAFALRHLLPAAPWGSFSSSYSSSPASSSFRNVSNPSSNSSFLNLNLNLNFNTPSSSTTPPPRARRTWSALFAPDRYIPPPPLFPASFSSSQTQSHVSAKNAYSPRVSATQVLYDNPAMFERATLELDPHLSVEDRWHAWLNVETQRRLLTACFVTDGHTAIYQQQRRAQEYDVSEHMPTIIPLVGRSSALWEASSAEEWASRLAADPEAGIPTFVSPSDQVTPEDLPVYARMDVAAMLGVEALRLPRRQLRSTTASSVSANNSPITDDAVVDHPHNISRHGGSQLSADQHQQPPSLRPETYGNALPSDVEERISNIFANCPVANTYLALHHTPLHDLLAVGGDSWVFSQKVLPATSFLEHQKRLKLWAEQSHQHSYQQQRQNQNQHYRSPSNGSANNTNTASPATGAASSSSSSVRFLGLGGLNAAKATVYAARAIVAFLDRRPSSHSDSHEETESTASDESWSVDLSDYWAMYVCALICWAFGHRARSTNPIPPPLREQQQQQQQHQRQRSINDNSNGGNNGGSSPLSRSAAGSADDQAIAWLRMVASPTMRLEDVRVRGLREANTGVVGLVRRLLESDCVGGRSRLYVDAVGVLKKLEEGANWKWF